MIPRSVSKPYPSHNSSFAFAHSSRQSHPAKFLHAKFFCLYLPIFSLFPSSGPFCFTSGLLQQLLSWSLTSEVPPTPPPSFLYANAKLNIGSQKKSWVFACLLNVKMLFHVMGESRRHTASEQPYIGCWDFTYEKVFDWLDRTECCRINRKTRWRSLQAKWSGKA